MKYILLSDSEFFDEYGDQAEALLAYRKYVAVSGGTSTLRYARY